MKFEADAEGANEVAAGLEALVGELNQDLAKVVNDQGAALQRTWRANARKTARSHGKHYDNAITHDMNQQEGSIFVDIGPDNALPQGRMGRGFEYGSVHQPPHYDGALAFAKHEPEFTEAVLDHIGYVIE